MPRKKSSAQLDREIAAVLAVPLVKAVTISVHPVEDADADDDAKDDDDEDDARDDGDRYVISDDGDEFDDSEETSTPDVQVAIDERRLHYSTLGRQVVVNDPTGRGWR